MPAPLSHNAGRMAVWLSSKLKPERDGDWTLSAAVSNRYAVCAWPERATRS